MASAAPQGAQPIVRDLGVGDQEVAVGVLARAFRDSPLNRAVIEGNRERRLHCNRHGMRALLASVQGSAPPMGLFRAPGAEPLAAVLVAAEPYRYPLPMPGLWRQLCCLFGQGLSVARRWGTVHEVLQQVHPRDPHWYLSVLGVDPILQGRGLGGELLLSWLTRVDRGHWPCYLETDRPENLPFYERAGFAVMNEVEVLGVRVWCMARQKPGSTARRAQP